jgi:hypothetical protein
MRIIAIDPGGVTGYSIFQLDFDSAGEPLWKDRFRQHWSDAGQLAGEHYSNLRYLLETQKADKILYERFEHRNNDFAFMMSLEYIGIIKEFAQTSKTKLYEQGASQALKWCDNEKMSKLGLLVSPYIPNKDMMAARKHLLFYLIHGLGNEEVRLHILRQLK